MTCSLCVNVPPFLLIFPQPCCNDSFDTSVTMGVFGMEICELSNPEVSNNNRALLCSAVFALFETMTFGLRGVSDAQLPVTLAKQNAPWPLDEIASMAHPRTSEMDRKKSLRIYADTGSEAVKCIYWESFINAWAGQSEEKIRWTCWRNVLFDAPKTNTAMWEIWGWTGRGRVG